MAASPPVTETRHDHPRPTAVPWAALAWSAVALALGLAWLSGVVAAGAPGQSGFGALFALLPTDASGPLNARTVSGAVSLLLGAVGAVGAVLMLRPPGGGGRAVEALSWTLGAVVLLVFVDGQLLSWLGYTMILPVAGWIVPGLFQLWAEATFTASHLSTLFFAVGVAVWGAAALTHRRAVRGACQHCGRAPEWNAGRERAVRARALRVGRIAVAVACVVALFYPSLRLPWLFGIPVGVSREQFDAMAADGGTIVIGVGLGTAGLVGVVLMLGLVQRWGVRFPRWMAGLSGRRVPVGLAVVPASLVAVALVAMGRSVVVEFLDAQARSLLTTEPLHAAAFASMAVWGAALGVATAAYAVRRRAECAGCGRGLPEVLPGDIRGARGVR
ncbi:hypothetical protein [Nocardiopsis deserti]|uniref:hypothetical protein n=1 Tax=Nocardiopsis deserti TaxID=2605988 RepID=UPI001238C073|nr:hypothetical protein [Nocardiopsis deserti]